MGLAGPHQWRSDSLFFIIYVSSLKEILSSGTFAFLEEIMLVFSTSVSNDCCNQPDLFLYF